MEPSITLLGSRKGIQAHTRRDTGDAELDQHFDLASEEFSTIHFYIEDGTGRLMARNIVLGIFPVCEEGRAHGEPLKIPLKWATEDTHAIYKWWQTFYRRVARERQYEYFDHPFKALAPMSDYVPYILPLTEFKEMRRYASAYYPMAAELGIEDAVLLRALNADMSAPQMSQLVKRSYAIWLNYYHWVDLLPIHHHTARIPSHSRLMAAMQRVRGGADIVVVAKNSRIILEVLQAMINPSDALVCRTNRTAAKQGVYGLLVTHKGKLHLRLADGSRMRIRATELDIYRKLTDTDTRIFKVD